MPVPKEDQASGDAANVKIFHQKRQHLYLNSPYKTEETFNYVP